MRKHFLQIFMLLLSFCIGSSIVSKGQSDTPHIPKPVIRGDALLCPNSTSILTVTEGYDTYQWYKRNFGANRAKVIEGATSNQIEVSSSEVPAYFSVLVSARGIKRKSDEKLVDGLVFLLPSVLIGGDFINGPGYSVLKEGDTGIFTLTKPYNTNITWFKNGKPIPGETSTKLYVTTGGVYTVQGAPRTCPNYIVPLGVDLAVKLRPNNNVPVITGDGSSVTTTSTTSTDMASKILTKTKLYPNPAKDYTTIDAAAFAGKNITVRFFATDGRTMLYKKYYAFAGSIKIGLGNINPGMYYVAVSDGTTQQMLKLVVTK